MRGHLQMMDNAAQANQEVGPQADDLPAILRPWRLDKGTSRIESGASSLRSLARPLIPIVNVGVGIGGEGAILFASRMSIQTDQSLVVVALATG